MVARNPDYTTTVTVPAVPHRVYYFARATNVTDQFQTYGNRGAELGDTSVNFLFGTTQSNTHAFFKVTLTDP